MAVALVGGAALGAALGELLKAVLDMKDRAAMFEPTFTLLHGTLTKLGPVIELMTAQNNALGRSEEELESLKTKMQEGKDLVNKCSRIKRINFHKRSRYQKKLKQLVDSLMMFFTIDIQAEMAGDLKEALRQLKTINNSEMEDRPLIICCNCCNGNGVATADVQRIGFRPANR